MKTILSVVVAVVMLMTADEVRAEVNCNLGVLATTIGPGVTAGCEKGRFGLSVFSTRGKDKNEILEVKTPEDKFWSAGQMEYNLSVEPATMTAVMGHWKIWPNISVDAGVSKIDCRSIAKGESKIIHQNGTIQPYWRIVRAECPDKFTPIVGVSGEWQLFKRVALKLGVSYLWLQPLDTSIQSENDTVTLLDGSQIAASGRQAAQDRLREATELSSIMGSIAVQVSF